MHTARFPSSATPSIFFRYSMALNEQDVARIARLARIELTPDQRGRAQAELNGILHLIERLQAVDTQGVEPLAHPLSAHEDITLRLREDAVSEQATEASRAELLANAPESADGLFLVPKVIE
ncbi:glutamyl-tRNA(GLN) amidotransferase subunit C [Bordetella bronchiseptica RB50]|nr:glutamyl-tRNA(GLN) amidotransferase subunit C [Bordetella bronchiseptica RB50]